MNSKIYWTGIEYNYDENSPEYGKLKGGFVYGFVKAFDVREALEKLLNKLKNEKLVPKEVEFVSPYDEQMEWETKEETSRYNQLFEEAKSLNQVIFDDFYAYENE